ncbi:MAG: DUF4071 domain-containing protein [Acidobacteriota bacterium]|nr:DUF4071 domain-containing protein [Acidobacteriota bacterium]
MPTDSPERPLCFVLMPFDRKPNPSPPPLEIDFNAVYRDLIAPAIRKADMEPLRADEEMSGGFIHRPMFERLILCEFAVADLTTANANVFYELGIRHAARPWSTVLLFAEGVRLPFDVGALRGLRYRITDAGTPLDPGPVMDALSARLTDARKAVDDSPLFQMLTGFRGPDLTQLTAESFHDQVRQSIQVKDRIAAAARQSVEALRKLEAELGALTQQTSSSLLSLFYAYRSLSSWTDMIRMAGEMPDYVASTVSVQEHYAMALNRDGQSERAERVLLDLIERRGPSSESQGLLGRVYKNRWQAAVKSGKTMLAQGLLQKALDAYVRGFEIDQRDYYPGINAVTLMEVRQPPDPRRTDLLPVVRYAVERKSRDGDPGYWGHATLLELAVLASDVDRAGSALASALAAGHEPWMTKSTADNLGLIRAAREQRGAAENWLTEIETALRES